MTADGGRSCPFQNALSAPGAGASELAGSYAVVGRFVEVT